MGTLSTTQECLDYMMLRASEPTTGSEFATDALMYLVIAHRELCAGATHIAPSVVATFPWAKGYPDKSITIPTKVTTGTVSITQNNTAVSFSGIHANSLIGWHITFGTTDTTMYYISAHTAGSTEATLDSECVVTSNSISTYTLFKIDHSVGSSDILRIVSPLKGYHSNSSGDDTNLVNGEEEISFKRAFSVPEQGEPTHFCILKNDNGTWKIRFNKYPTGYSKIDVPYIVIPDDLDVTGTDPSVPVWHRKTLCELALYYWFQAIGDTKADGSFQMAAAGYSAMLKEVGITDATFQRWKPNEEIKNVL